MEENESKGTYIPFKKGEVVSPKYAFGVFKGRLKSQDRFQGFGKDMVLFPIGLISTISNYAEKTKEGVGLFDDFIDNIVCPRIKAYIRKDDESYERVELAHREHQQERSQKEYDGFYFDNEGNVFLTYDTEQKHQLFNEPLSPTLIKGIENRLNPVKIDKYQPITGTDISNIALDHYVPIYYMLKREYALRVWNVDVAPEWDETRKLPEESKQRYTLIDLNDYLRFLASNIMPDAFSNSVNYDEFCRMIKRSGGMPRVKEGKTIEHVIQEKGLNINFDFEMLKKMCCDIVKTFIGDDNIRKAYFSLQLMGSSLNSVKGKG